MKIELRHYGRVRGGEIIYDLPDLLRQNLLELEGKDIVMTIKKRHVRVTGSQYGFYRGCILVECHKAERYKSMDTKDSIHDLYFAPKFLSHKELVEVGDDRYEISITRSLADISKEEMSEFIDRVIADCSENNITVPPPELYYNKYYQK